MKILSTNYDLRVGGSFDHFPDKRCRRHYKQHPQKLKLRGRTKNVRIRPSGFVLEIPHFPVRSEYRFHVCRDTEPRGSQTIVKDFWLQIQF